MNLLSRKELKAVKGGLEEEGNCCARLEINGEVQVDKCGLTYQEAYDQATQYGMLRSLEPTAHGFYRCGYMA